MSMPIDVPRVQKALARICATGILHPPEDIVATVRDPHWDQAFLAHDWRRHVPPTMRNIWDTLPLHTRLCVYESAEYAALEEDMDSVLLTAPTPAER